MSYSNLNWRSIVFNNVLIALKEDLPPEPLINLAKRAAASAAKMHLVTLVRVGTDENELERLTRARSGLETYVAELQRDGYDADAFVTVMAVGAGFDLARVAVEKETDLMVIGLAKRSRVGKALMGSDAQRILLSATCPVLVSRLYEDRHLTGI